MRRMSTPLAFATCLSLLSLQLTGMHAHADDHGYVGIPESSFTHSHDHSGQHDGHPAETADPEHAGHGGTDHSNYDDAHDVSLLDLAAGVFKMPLAILALILLFAVVPLVRSLGCAAIAYPVLSGRYTRWRPPLRAPPQPA